MWNNGDYVAFDTESTGLGSSARIIEIAVVPFMGGVPQEPWSRLVWPGDIDWNSENVRGALAVNKITREELIGKPTFADILTDLLFELTSGVWVAHNAEFDMRMLQQELAYLSSPPALRPQLVVCTKLLSTYLSPGIRGHRLSDVSARFSVSQQNAHRAVDDAIVCGRVFAEMLRSGRLPEEDSQMTALLERQETKWRTRH